MGDGVRTGPMIEAEGLAKQYGQTCALPDAGRATVAGIDVVKHPGQVRRYIGVAAQDVTLDPLLSGRQNLVIAGELSGMGRAGSPAPSGPARRVPRSARCPTPGP